MFVVFLLHHDVAVVLGVGPGCLWAVERRHAAPAVVGRLGLALDTEPGFWASGPTTSGGRLLTFVLVPQFPF